MTKQILWEPTNIEKTQLYQFMRAQGFSTYNDIYKWSVSHPDQFWEKIWQENQILHSMGYTQVVDDITQMPGAKWFKGSRLNFAENLLRYRDNQNAIIFKKENTTLQYYTRRELYNAVAKVASQLRQWGIKPGDRVAAIVANIPETVIAMLATVAVGGVWSSCSPDFGVEGIVSRFDQITPKILVSINGYYYKGNYVDVSEKALAVMDQVSSIENVIVIPYGESQTDCFHENVQLMTSLLSAADVPELVFEQLPFDHPIYILYSSGTTGVPKCIVHGAGGTLLQHLKELKLHCDLRCSDRLFYFTTCGWMMWNWMVTGLAVGSAIVLFDGNPFYPSVNALWDLVDEAEINVFGTSAKYLSASEKMGAVPTRTHALGSLRAILSTGSPLTDESFDYVYRDVKANVMLSSISGGTDIVSCFVLGNPVLPVVKGEIQCRGLGMNVQSVNTQGDSVIGEKGELVCRSAFPSMPIYFWNDDTNQQKYKDAYFNNNDNQWRHGDYITVTPNGGVMIWGRSDTTLNPGGVRIGTAEIYRVVEQFSEIMDSVVVGKQIESDEKVILFVKMKNGSILTPEIKKNIRNKIKQECTSRHVPSIINAVADIPYTMSGKKVEIAVKKIINGQDFVENKDALQNPEALQYFKLT